MPSAGGKDSLSAVQIQFAIDDASSADAIVTRLLEDRLVACGQRLGPVTSSYRWNGALQSAEEWIVVLKTRDALARVVVESIKALHTYEIPEILILEVSGGDAGYLAWVDRETSPPA
jgi:periplasmic divalent cation tolerance protein